MKNNREYTGNVIRINYTEIKSQLEKILIKEGFKRDKASDLSKIFSDNSLCGKDSHGINRFISFITSVRKGYVKVDGEPQKISGNNAVEHWEGNYGPGPLNAKFCTNRAISLADRFDIGSVTLRNTNHWMRGGTYGWEAAEAGFILICWTNAIPMMPPWGGEEPKLGNNPLVIAVPNGSRHIVLDMALSQYSYGRLEKLVQAGKRTDYYAGYDEDGNLTKDPSAVLKTRRALPIGLWKGSGLALMFDLIATIVSGGRSSFAIGKGKSETGVSQVFFAVKPSSGENNNTENIIKNVLDDIRSSSVNENVFYPGEISFNEKDKNLNLGVPVDKIVWNEILKM